MQLSLTERYRGALLGLACGDAVGTSVEFQPRGSFKPLTDMVGGGPFNLEATADALLRAATLTQSGARDE